MVYAGVHAVAECQRPFGLIRTSKYFMFSLVKVTPTHVRLCLKSDSLDFTHLYVLARRKLILPWNYLRWFSV
jgi:hypothetical protein